MVVWWTHSCAKFPAPIIKCLVVVNSLILTAALKGHSEEREWQIDKAVKWGTIHLLLPMELPFVDGTKAVTKIRGPGFMTCVWLCLGSPCFNKHLDAERGPASLNTALLHKCTGKITPRTVNIRPHVFVVFVCNYFSPIPTLPKCLTGASPPYRPALAGWHVGLAPDLLPWHRNPLKTV